MKRIWVTNGNEVHRILESEIDAYILIYAQREAAMSELLRIYFHNLLEILEKY